MCAYSKNVNFLATQYTQNKLFIKKIIIILAIHFMGIFSKRYLIFFIHQDLFKAKNQSLKGQFVYICDLKTEIGEKRLRILRFKKMRPIEIKNATTAIRRFLISENRPPLLYSVHSVPYWLIICHRAIYPSFFTLHHRVLRGVECGNFLEIFKQNIWIYRFFMLKYCIRLEDDLRKVL